MSETVFFESHKSEWIKTHAHQWVWVHGTDFEFFSSFEKAIETAYARGFGDRPVFIKQVLAHEVPLFIAGLNHRFQWAK